jgi:hypothetical protein
MTRSVPPRLTSTVTAPERRDVRNRDRRACLETLVRIQPIQEGRRRMKALRDFFDQRRVAERGQAGLIGQVRRNVVDKRAGRVGVGNGVLGRLSTLIGSAEG